MRHLFSLGLASFLLLMGCDSSTGPPAPLVFYPEFSANVSTYYGPLGAERQNAKDNTPPDFRWTRSDGTLDSLSGHFGTMIMLNFWATWCGPCKSEMPYIQELSDDLKDSLLVIGIADDNVGHAFSTVQDYVRSKNLAYQFVVDSNYRIYEKYELFPPTSPIPVSVFIGTDGLIQYTVVGAASSEAQLLQIIRQHVQ